MKPALEVPVQDVFLPEASAHFSTKIFSLHYVTLHYPVICFLLKGFPAFRHQNFLITLCYIALPCDMFSAKRIS